MENARISVFSLYLVSGLSPTPFSGLTKRSPSVVRSTDYGNTLGRHRTRVPSTETEDCVKPETVFTALCPLTSHNSQLSALKL